ncbi:WD40 repeat-like protein [Aureobasidium pullulans]|uniref:WD40 repeat-like protein n=1 Tax=Aureobasidium pullulans TaxID=5580 RepID=A0A4V4LEL5_AURPU|nr:WD40 repeat-like protein [Aureobasidium pullulans]
MSNMDMLCSSQSSNVDLPISPTAAPSSTAVSSKPRGQPSITPRRFTRFFTPITTRSTTGSKSSKRLKDITKNAVNQVKFTGFHDLPQFETPRKKRKILPTPESSPVQPLDSSPLRPLDYHVPSNLSHRIDYDFDDSDIEEEDEDEEAEEEKHFPAPITRLRDFGTSGRILQRSFGGARGVGRGRINDHCVPDWRAQTADYYTRPEDCHNYRGQALPFCVTRCNTNSLVAIGDEEGGVRLIDSAYADNSFSQHHVSFKPHHNAIMDLAFSSDDYLFASASGDQTSRIVDMHTQQTRYVMHSHTSSVKQVRFQPGNDSIVATSSRDGSVMIWDLRCRGQDAPVVDYAVSFEPGNSMVNSARRANTVTYASSVNSMRDAHGLQQESRRSDISVTALSFLSDSRSHLLLTATEANASVKLWDLRGKYTSRRNGPSVPVSSTREPEAHFKHRQFGISSLALSGDGSRFYALCRDSTVYAYSTNHLIMGSAPEYEPSSNTQASKWFRPRQGLSGNGPLYGFRHPMFKSTSFYVKSALRPATSSHPEMLAVGSREGCAVLFPTDEAFLKKKSPQPSSGISTPIIEQDGAYGPRSRTGSAAKFEDTSLPIYNQGTALIRAHGRSEVTGLAWSTEGELVTLGDDFTARCWRDNDRNAAKGMRICGEGQGARWGWGWADVEGYDEEEG